MCAGGVLAYEVARQLQAQGQQVALVALLDSADVETPKRAGHIAGKRMSRFSETFSQGKQTAPLAAMVVHSEQSGAKSDKSDCL